MNIERTLKCIEMLEHATNLNMENFQSDNCSTIEELHACGNTACFAGYLAISDFFNQDGGRRSFGNEPWFENEHGHYAVAKYLEISKHEADSLVYGELVEGSEDFDYSVYYEKNWNEVSAQDVIKKLREMMKRDLCVDFL